MQCFYPPQHVPDSLQKPLVFLAGSIEMGEAEDWQSQVTQALSNTDCTILNPRRNDWDDSWEQKMDNPLFYGQVQWELAGLERADIIALYLSPETRSPISLLELGLYARSKKIFLCCPDGFWRKGNVDIICEKFGIPQYATIPDLVHAIQLQILNI